MLIMEVSLPVECNESPVGPAELLLRADTVASSGRTADFTEAPSAGALQDYSRPLIQ